MPTAKSNSQKQPFVDRLYVQDYCGITGQDSYEKLKKEFCPINEPDAFPENIVDFKKNFKKDVLQDALLWKLV